MAQGRPEPPSAGIGLRILLGTSGWSYDDWVGPVYPPALRDRPGEWLSHYAQEFETVEINSTFYRLPSAAVVAGWIRKAREVGGPFEFSLKAPQDATHVAMPAGDAARTAEALAPFARDVVAPLAAAGLLGAVLLQVSPHLHRRAASLGALAAAIEALAPHPVAVEVRHRSWMDGERVQGDLVDLLRSHGAALAAVDGPGFPPRTIPTGRHAYVRFHGRRADVWFDADRSEGDGTPASARYDYLYSDAELEPWARVVRSVSRETETVRVYFNNHPGGKAVANARGFGVLLGLPPPVRPPKPQRVLDDF